MLIGRLQPQRRQTLIVWSFDLIAQGKGGGLLQSRPRLNVALHRINQRSEPMSQARARGGGGSIVRAPMASTVLISHAQVFLPPITINF
jgi:hypothetical protein